MTLVSTNFGIVLAYCGMQLYWLDLVKAAPAEISAGKTI